MDAYTYAECILLRMLALFNTGHMKYLAPVDMSKRRYRRLNQNEQTVEIGSCNFTSAPVEMHMHPVFEEVLVLAALSAQARRLASSRASGVNGMHADATCIARDVPPP